MQSCLVGEKFEHSSNLVSTYVNYLERGSTSPPTTTLRLVLWTRSEQAFVACSVQCCLQYGKQCFDHY